jgi:hypothetical protein
VGRTVFESEFAAYFTELEFADRKGWLHHIPEGRRTPQGVIEHIMQSYAWWKVYEEPGSLEQLGRIYRQLDKTRFNDTVRQAGSVIDNTNLPLLESPAMKRAREFGVPTSGYENRWRLTESWPPRMQIGEPIQDMLPRSSVRHDRIYTPFLNDPRLTGLARALESFPRQRDRFGEFVPVRRYIYVIDVDGRVLVAPRSAGNHSDLVQGANVLVPYQSNSDTKNKEFQARVD